MQCSNHLKQMGIAVHTFHDSRNGVIPSTLGRGAMTGWVLMFPFIEQTPLADALKGLETQPGQAHPQNPGTTTGEWAPCYTTMGGWINDYTSLKVNGDVAHRNSLCVPIYYCPTRRSAPAYYGTVR